MANIIEQTKQRANDEAQRRLAAAGPPPDEYPGWEFDAPKNAWVDPSNGHPLWVQQNQVNAANEQGQSRLGGAQDELRAAINPAQLDPYRADRAAALTDQRETLKFALGLQGPQRVTPEERMAIEQRFAEQATTQANAVAANTRGGAGAVAAARQQLQQQAPQIAGGANAQAQQAVQQEEALRLQEFHSRIGQAQVAGGIANAIGQTSLGAFGQETNVQGQTLQMAQDLAGLGLDYAKLDVSTQLSIFDGLLRKYGIDEQTAAQMRIAAQANEKGPLDYISQIAGIATSVAAPVPGLLKAFGGRAPTAPQLDTVNPYG